MKMIHDYFVQENQAYLRQRIKYNNIKVTTVYILK